SFQALNPIWIVLMSPVLAYFYRKLHQHNILFSIPYKFAFGMTMCAFLLAHIPKYLISATRPSKESLC
ncbi:hypothetical protein MXE00_15950, partial [Legionella pneumophila]|nr:hypothetical protein [Legionella pneumophila]